jgi:hypothetical protein
MTDQMILDLVGKVSELLDKQIDLEKNTLKKDIVPSVSPTMDATNFHGLNGLLGDDCSLDREVVANIVKPQGLLTVLPALPTRLEQWRTAAITGYNPDSTPEPETPCEDAPSGTYSTCRLEFNLGRIARDSKTININEAIRRANLGDTDFVLRGSMLGNGLGNLGSPMTTGDDNARIMNIITLSEIKGIGINLTRELSRMIWSGDSTAPAPANTAGGGRVEFDGLDLLINTGIADAKTLELCPAMDSLVYDFNFANICDAAADPNIVRVLSNAEFRIRDIAERTGLAPVQWVIVMSRMAFYELSECWPCMYNTYRCGDQSTGITGDTTPVRFNDGTNRRMIDEYRNGMFIPINGVNYPVIVDDGITELSNADDPANLPEVGMYSSSIYFIPLTIQGGWPVTYLTYLDHSFAAADMQFLNNQTTFWTDSGRFMWASEFVKWCYKLSAEIQPGLVFRTPHLAFKVENVMYQPTFKERSAFPGDPEYLAS